MKKCLHIFLFLFIASLSALAMENAREDFAIEIISNNIKEFVLPQAHGSESYFQSIFPSIFSNSDIKIIQNDEKSMKYPIVRLDDDSQWVIILDKPVARIKGYLYLKNAIKNCGLKHVNACHNVFIILDNKHILLSQYVSGERVKIDEVGNVLQLEFFIVNNIIGYDDINDDRNFRLIDEKLYFFDIEPNSFHSSKVEQINQIKPVFYKK